jgi:hypothetical protein
MSDDNFNGKVLEMIGSMPPALELDHAKYMGDLEEFDPSDKQKRELLETLWSIMSTFVQLGFAPNICEQIFDRTGDDDADAVDGGDSAGQKEGRDG